MVSQRRLFSPRRGFYVIVPTEHRLTGIVPATLYLDEMMRFLEEPYYVGLLSAASLHGAAHQQPQRLQVLSTTQIRPTGSEGGRIAWIRKQSLPDTPTEQRRTPNGYLTISTPEATACDLVQYAGRVGGLGNVATVLRELAPLLIPERLPAAANAADGAAVIQRLGYLLELVAPDASRSACETLERWLASRPIWAVPIRRNRSTAGARLSSRWNLLLNDLIDADTASEPGPAVASWQEWIEDAEWGDNDPEEKL